MTVQHLAICADGRVIVDLTSRPTAASAQTLWSTAHPPRLRMHKIDHFYGVRDENGRRLLGKLDSDDSILGPSPADLDLPGQHLYQRHLDAIVATAKDPSLTVPDRGAPPVGVSTTVPVQVFNLDLAGILPQKTVLAMAPGVRVEIAHTSRAGYKVAVRAFVTSRKPDTKARLTVPDGELAPLGEVLPGFSLTDAGWRMSVLGGTFGDNRTRWTVNAPAPALRSVLRYAATHNPAPDPTLLEGLDLGRRIRADFVQHAGGRALEADRRALHGAVAFVHTGGSPDVRKALSPTVQAYLRQSGILATFDDAFVYGDFRPDGSPVRDGRPAPASDTVPVTLTDLAGDVDSVIGELADRGRSG